MLQIDDLLRKITDLERPDARAKGPRRTHLKMSERFSNIYLVFQIVSFGDTKCHKGEKITKMMYHRQNT